MFQREKGTQIRPSKFRYTPDASLAWASVVTVLCSVPRDHLEVPVVPLQGEVDLQNVGAWLNQLENTSAFLFFQLPRYSLVLHVLVNKFILHQDTGFVEEKLHHLKKARVLRGGDVLQPVGDLPRAGHSRRGV